VCLAAETAKNALTIAIRRILLVIQPDQRGLQKIWPAHDCSGGYPIGRTECLCSLGDLTGGWCAHRRIAMCQPSRRNSSVSASRSTFAVFQPATVQAIAWLCPDFASLAHQGR
jgi:hypothetical protein